MRILYVRNAFSHDFGGAERLVVHFAKEALLNDMEALVVSRQKSLLAYAESLEVPHTTGWWWSQQDWSGWRVLGFPIYVLWQIVLFFWYLQLIVRTKPSSVHLMSKDDFIAGTFAGRLLGKTVVWTDCADLKHLFRNHRTWFKNPVGKLVYLSAKFANVVTLVSNSEQALIEESLGKKVPSNFEVIHTAGKDESATPVERPKNTVIFCSTSRLVIAKGIQEIIAAFNSNEIKGLGYELWLVGDGPDKEQFLAEAKGNNSIKFIGQTPQPLSYVIASDVFVQPTHHEGFSLSLAEAAMLGKPMIASNVGGNPELVNETNGILFTVKDVPDLIQAVLTLGKDANLREKLGKQARKDYKEKFDFAVIYKQKFLKIYR